MEHQLPSELQRIPVHGMTLFFEGHVFKLLGNILVAFGGQHKFFVLSKMRLRDALKGSLLEASLQTRLGLDLGHSCHFAVESIMVPQNDARRCSPR
jgi:hypothetical protein